MEDALRQLEADNHYLRQLLAVLEQKVAILEQELLLHKSLPKANKDDKYPSNYLQGNPTDSKIPLQLLTGESDK